MRIGAGSVIALLMLANQPVSAEAKNDLRRNLAELTNTVGVTGYESAVTQKIVAHLAGLQAKTDAMGNVTVTFGTGAPRRLIATPVDEPGYVVSKIDAEGYLRVQRLPQGGLPPHSNELMNAQPMAIGTRGGGMLSAVAAGLSIHLEPGRINTPDPDDLDNFYLDAGANTAAQVLQEGVDVLSPVAAARQLMPVGMTEWTGTAVGDRYGAALLLQLADSLRTAPVKGTLTLAFVVQQWSGSRGLTRVLQEQHPDELVFIGRARTAAGAQATPPTLGSGVYAYAANAESKDLQETLQHNGVVLHQEAAASILMRGYGPGVSLPRNTVHLGVPLLWPTTAGETLDERDLTALLSVLATYVGVSLPIEPARENTAMGYVPLPPRPASPPTTRTLLRTLTETYGVSGDERMTREAVERLLPSWAKPTTDASGNLILRFGKQDSGKGVMFMAHTDELGFRVKAVLPDGTLDLENKGGGTTSFYWGHVAMVHTGAGMRAGVVELPEGWDTAQFHFPADFRAPAKMHVGAASADAVVALGIKVGDTVTIPKQFRPLLNQRATVRSMDDRVGCAAMLRTVWELGPSFNRNVTFVWSTREELGLEGALEYAGRANDAGTVPATVFAIDTFVSSDSPIESKRFADAELGKGFVIRAIDNSNLAPWKDVQKLQALATAHNIPVQYGVTGGGNDGSVFTRYGAVDVPLSWPLRYSHSPAELIDLRDLDALAQVTTALARSW